MNERKRTQNLRFCVDLGFLCCRFGSIYGNLYVLIQMKQKLRRIALRRSFLFFVGCGVNLCRFCIDYISLSITKGSRKENVMETVFTVNSETYAEKTRRLLQRSRIRFRVVRTTTSQGCTAKFFVMGDAAPIFSLLQANRIPYHQGG